MNWVGRKLYERRDLEELERKSLAMAALNHQLVVKTSQSSCICGAKFSISETYLRFSSGQSARGKKAHQDIYGSEHFPRKGFYWLRHAPRAIRNRSLTWQPDWVQSYARQKLKSFTQFELKLCHCWAFPHPKVIKSTSQSPLHIDAIAKPSFYVLMRCSSFPIRHVMQ